jgi:hypothetical protein
MVLLISASCTARITGAKLTFLRWWWWRRKAANRRKVRVERMGKKSAHRSLN